MLQSLIWTVLGAVIGIGGTVIVQKQSDKKHEELERCKADQEAKQKRAQQLRYWNNLNDGTDGQPIDPTTMSLFYDVRDWARANEIALTNGDKIPVSGRNLPLDMIYQRIAPGMLPQEVEQLANVVTSVAGYVKGNMANDPTDEHLKYELRYLGDHAQELVKAPIMLESTGA